MLSSCLQEHEVHPDVLELSGGSWSSQDEVTGVSHSRRKPRVLISVCAWDPCWKQPTGAAQQAVFWGAVSETWRSCKEACSVYRSFSIRHISRAVELQGLALGTLAARYLCSVVCSLLQLRFPWSGFITSHSQREGFGRSNNEFSSSQCWILKVLLLAMSHTDDWGRKWSIPSAVTCSHNASGCLIQMNFAQIA